jgi:hypothetical protein
MSWIPHTPHPIPRICHSQHPYPYLIILYCSRPPVLYCSEMGKWVSIGKRFPLLDSVPDARLSVACIRRPWVMVALQTWHSFMIEFSNFVNFF